MKQALLIYVAVNAVLSIFMARFVIRDFQRIRRVSVPVAIWTGVAMHGHALATFAMAWIDRGSLYALSYWTAAGGGLVLVIGAYIIFLGRSAYGDRARVYGLKEDELIDRGVYRWSRNPQYFGYWLMFVGAGLASGSWLTLAFAAAFAVFIDVYIRVVEEPHLKRVFGEAYSAYRQRVSRYWSLPRSSD